MTQYRRGADFERTVKRLLETNGYDCIRSAGSRSPVDVVAFKLGQVVMVQAKLDGRCAPAERAALLRVAGLVGAGLPDAPAGHTIPAVVRNRRDGLG